MRFKNISYPLLFAFIVSLPLLSREPYYLHIMISIFILSILALTLRLVLLTGLFSLGHAAFWGIGAYASAKLVMGLGISFWAALPLSGLVTVLIGVLIGYPTLRIKGVYFALITLAFCEIVRLSIIHWSDFLGGLAGIPSIPRPSFGPIVFMSKVPYYYLALALVALTTAVMWRIDRSRTGSIFRAIRENDVLAESIGINLMKYKMLAWMIACFFTGIAGSFYAHYMLFISPEYFTVWESIFLFLFIIIGGIRTIFGPILGAALFAMLPEFLGAFEQWEPVIFAVLLILIVFFLPHGLISLPEELSHRYARLKTVILQRGKVGHGSP